MEAGLVRPEAIEIGLAVEMAVDEPPHEVPADRAGVVVEVPPVGQATRKVATPGQVEAVHLVGQAEAGEAEAAPRQGPRRLLRLTPRVMASLRRAPGVPRRTSQDA